MSHLLANIKTKFSGAMHLCAALCVLGLSLISSSALAQDGLPNTSFGSNGRTQIPAQPYVSDKNAMVVLPDGKIVVAGRRPNSNELVMFMYNTDGTPNVSFGPGTVIGNFAGVVGLPKLAFDAQRDGILLAADFDENGTRLIMVCRILRNGAPDLSISAGGAVPGCNFRVAPPSAPNGLAVTGIAKSRSGTEAIYVTGNAYDFSPTITDFSRTFVYTLFPSLQINWRVEATTPGTTSTHTYGGLSEVDDAGRMFSVGSISVQDDTSSLVQLIDVNQGFGIRSRFNPNLIPQGYDIAHAVAFTSSARTRIVVVGESQRTAAGASDCTLTQYDTGVGLTAMTRDLNFGGAGIGYVRSNFTSFFNDSAQCTAISVDGQGRIYVSGVLAFANGPGSYFDVDIVVARFSPTGVLDTTYGPNGQGYVLLDNGFDDPIFGAFGYDAAVGIGLTANGAVVASKRSPMTGSNVQNTTWWLNGLTGTAVASELMFKNGFE